MNRKSYNVSLDGGLLVDKPAGPTSHDIVDAVRRRFKLKKVGHCGTLDPNATGLLLLVLGRATKLSERLMSDDKVYEGRFRLGEATSTHDAQGERTETRPVPQDLSLESLSEAAASFVGDQMQTPPMVSAVKKDGVPLYKLARKGIEIERPAKLIHVYSFTIHSFDSPEADFTVACTKGTYVRTLVHDLGEKLGCGAHLTQLRRTQSGKFKVADAIPLDDILAMSLPELESRVIPILRLAPITVA